MKIRGPTLTSTSHKLLTKRKFMDAEQVKKILAKTDWRAYWDSVSEGVESEVRAYDEALRKSLARAHKKMLRTA